MRVIEITGVEYNMCCGTHLANTSEIQVIILTGHDKHAGHVRLYFMAGNRAIDSMRKSQEIERKLTTLLSGGSNKFVESVTALQTEKRDLLRATTRLTKEYSTLIAEQLFKEAQSNGRQWVHFHREESDVLFLQSIADGFGLLLNPSSDPETKQDQVEKKKT